MPDQYRVRDPDTDEILGNLRAASINDAVNRFARSASATFVDRGSDLLSEFVDYSVWDIDVRPVGSAEWERRFSGFVIEQDYDQSETSVDFLSHDHWLKRRTVDREFSDADATDIVIELVTDFTPLSVDPADVTFEDEPTGVNETFKGVTPAEIIATLTESSANEQFGATNDLEFFLRPFDPNGNGGLELRPGRYRRTEWEDDNRSQINQVRVKYGADGDNEVVVSDKAAQQDLGEAIGVDEGVILEESKTFEGIPSDDRDTARAKADAILERGDALAIGEIETFNVGTVRPGQIVAVEDPDAGVDDDFRIASVSLNATGMDSVLVAENREGVLDDLESLSEEQDRIEAREGELSPTVSTEFLTQAFDIEIDWSLRALQRTYLDTHLLLGSESAGTRVTTIESGTTETVAAGETREESGVALNGELALDGELKIGEPLPSFDAPGGVLGHEFPIVSPTLAVDANTTTTIDAGEREQTGGVELNGELALNGELRIGNEVPHATAGGVLGDGFKNQTVLTQTQ